MASSLTFSDYSFPSLRCSKSPSALSVNHDPTVTAAKSTFTFPWPARGRRPAQGLPSRLLACTFGGIFGRRREFPAGVVFCGVWLFSSSGEEGLGRGKAAVGPVIQGTPRLYRVAREAETGVYVHPFFQCKVFRSLYHFVHT